MTVTAPAPSDRDAAVAAPGGGVRARAELALAAVGGRTSWGRARCEPPLTFRAIRPGGPGVHLAWVSTAAGPIGGDDLTVALDVDDGADVTITSTGAALALPGPHGERSRLAIEAAVGASASLTWRPEPTIVAAGADHEAVTRLRAAPGSSVTWVDELVLGRHGEAPGRCRSRLAVDVGTTPALRTGLDVGAPGWDGPAGLGGARYVAQVLVLAASGAPALDRPPRHDGAVRASTTRLGAAGAWLRTIVAHDVLAGRDEVAASLGDGPPPASRTSGGAGRPR